MSAGQSRTHSAMEVATSTAFGMLVSAIANAVLFPLFGMHVTAMQNFWLVYIYTVISVARSYVFRRLFNHFTHGRKS